MKTYQNSPVQPVTFGEANEITLNNYYDILKAHGGSLAEGELLQLKVSSDIVDITEKSNEDGGYEWFSRYNLLNRADSQLEVEPVAGTAEVGLARFSEVYGRFLAKLSRFVLLKELSPEDLKRKSDLELEVASITTQLGHLSDNDLVNWKKYCELRGINIADTARYVQWSDMFGNSRKIQEFLEVKAQKDFEIIQIIDRKYNDPHDEEIVKALVKYRSPGMKMCFPTAEDYMYHPVKINMQYLLGLLPAETGQFDYRFYTGFNVDPQTIKTSGAGAFTAKFDRTTSNSSTITTNWNTSGSGRYKFIKVKVSASEHTEISEDFRTATEIKLGAKSSLRVNINYGGWFNANLFRSKYIQARPDLFMEFFGKDGSLVLYPKALILVRGISMDFINTQNWKYDYVRNFKAKGKGGFGAFGFNVGAGVSYSKNTQEHKIDQAGTSLKIADDEKTVRFVGYAVLKNRILTDDNENAFISANKINVGLKITAKKRSKANGKVLMEELS